MEVRLIAPEGVRMAEPGDLVDLLVDGAGVVWVDVPEGDPDAVRVLTEVFCFHPKAVADAASRSPVPKVHLYADHAFVVLHAPEPGTGGHIHFVELDLFVSARYLVTVHGPVNPAVPQEATRVETDAVAARVDSGRFRPTTGYELSTAVVSALTGRMRDHLAVRTADVWRFEQQVTGGQLGDAERFLDGMFRVRHGLLSVRTMAAQSAEVFGRMRTREVYGPEHHALLEDNEDQFRRIATMAHTQEDYLQGVIEFYQTRTNTKMTIAAERLAVIAAVTLPVTAISSVMGMNVIVSAETHWGWVTVLLSGMIVMSVALLIWARRQGWW